MRKRAYKIGDVVRVTQLPPDIRTLPKESRAAFRYAVGKTFRVEGFGRYGHLELVVHERRPSRDRYESDTIWIEPEFVVLAEKKSKTIRAKK